ncbi:MAG: FtsX-like permease family protein [Rhodocyclaceae bacterium]|nr:FtsX-like permease family protein [Rhodocyclaceae bacterium]
MIRGVAAVFVGGLLRRRAASGLSVLAIALGVALGLAVQLINDAALAEFGRGLRTLAGEADLRLVGPASGFDDALFEAVALHPLVADASPVVDVSARAQGQEAAIPVLGLDVLRLPAVQPALIPRTDEDRASTAFAGFRQAGVFLSPVLATRLRLAADTPLVLKGSAGALELAVLGSVPGAGAESVAVMDIHAAQHAFGMTGRLSRIDLRLRPGATPDDAARALATLLPAGVVAVTPQASVAQARGLSRAYRVNLTMLAVIALVCGGFLVFSTQALSIARRRTEFAFLRAIGLGRRRLRAWLLGEGALLGIAGGALGCALGVGFAAAALDWIGGDLGAGYFSGIAPSLVVSPGAVAAFLALGVMAGLAGAWIPARRAGAIAPAAALKAGAGDPLSAAPGWPWLGPLCLLLALAACLPPPLAGIPVGGYAAVALLLVGGVLSLGRLSRVVSAWCPPVPVPLGLARARLQAAPGQVVVAAAGVLASSALAIAMAVMVASFRDSVDQWLTKVLPAELYVRAAERNQAGHLSVAVQRRLAAMPGVARVDFLRHDRVILDAGLAPVSLIARPVSEDGHELPLVGEQVAAADPVWVSEALVDLLGLAPGMPLQVPLAGRSHPFTVAGAWRDYARQGGALVMPLARYRELSGDALADDAAVHLAPGHDVGGFAAAIDETFPAADLEMASPGEIRRISLRIFDRSFAVTYLLEAAAVLIGLAGIAASFAAMAAARRREFGMLRHLGLGRRQIAAMIAAEGGLTAASGALGGVLVGGAIALVLVEVVNRQSFHWSMDYRVPWWSLSLFLVVLVALAACAAVLAGRLAMSGSAVRAVSEDW